MIVLTIIYSFLEPVLDVNEAKGIREQKYSSIKAFLESLSPSQLQRLEVSMYGLHCYFPIFQVYTSFFTINEQLQ